MKHVLVTGASGLVGSQIAASLRADGHRVTGTYRNHADRVPEGVEPLPFDADDPEGALLLIDALRPEVVIHTAAMPDIALCEREPHRAQRVNCECPGSLARSCASLGSRFISFSTDQVFDGTHDQYCEDSPTSPVHVYGRVKAEGERLVLDAYPQALVIRISLVIGRSPSGTRSASEGLVNRLRSGERMGLFDDEIRCPVLVDDVARIVTHLATETTSGILHIAGPDPVSRYTLGVALADAFGLDSSLIDRRRSAEANIVPPRPRRLELAIDRLRTTVSQPPLGIRDAVTKIAAASD